MELIQLCENLSGLEASRVHTFVNNRASSGPMPIQISITDDFVGSVILEGALSDEVDTDLIVWAPITGAIWTENAIDALFVYITHIRVRILDYVSGSTSVRLGY